MKALVSVDLNQAVKALRVSSFDDEGDEGLFDASASYISLSRFGSLSDGDVDNRDNGAHAVGWVADSP